MRRRQDRQAEAFKQFQYLTVPLHPSANAEQRIGAMMNARWTM